jgi:hypothetical protein
MVDYPYTIKPSSLEDFLKNMPDRPEPTTKITQEYLKKLDYTSSNDLAIIPILKFIGFIDASGNITELFKTFRDTRKSKAVIAQALRTAYSDLFSVYANPSAENLENYFRTSTGRAGRALQATENTFKTLCKFADFGATAVTPTPTITQTPQQVTQPVVQAPVTKEGGVNIAVNIRFELPITKDSDVYDKIFESLKKHLLTPSTKSD